MADGLVDPIGFDVSGSQYEDFVNALIDAFPTYAALRALARFRLDLNLATIAGENAPLDDVAFRLIQDQLAKGHFLRLLAAARASRPGNPRLAFFAEPFALAAETRPAAVLEKIITAANSFLDITAWRERLGEIEARICRVEVQTRAGMVHGTGFLIGPDRVLTNFHVVEAVIAGENNQSTAGGLTARKGDVVLRFDYKELAGGVTSPGTPQPLMEILDYSPYDPVDLQPAPKPGTPDPEHLDYALLRIGTTERGKPLGERPIGGKAEPDAPARGAIAIPAADWPFDRHSPLFIVQHPDGGPMRLALDTDAILDLNGNRTRVTYKTNTLGGSSGSPCFNQHLELVALHHAGDPKSGPLYHPGFNEGIPIAAVRELLRTRNQLTGITLAPS